MRQNETGYYPNHTFASLRLRIEIRVGKEIINRLRMSLQDVSLERIGADKREGQESPKISEDVLLYYAGRPASAALNSLRGDDRLGKPEIGKGHQRKREESRGTISYFYKSISVLLSIVLPTTRANET